MDESVELPNGPRSVPGANCGRPRAQRRLELLALLLLAGCGARDQVAATDLAGPARTPPSRYPAAAFIVGRGQSTLGPAAAEADARRVVAEQIASSLAASLDVKESDVDGRPSARVDSRVLLRTFFDRAELIRVDPTETRCVDSRCQALATLERAAAVSALAAEYENARGVSPLACDANYLDPFALIQARRRAEQTFPDLAARARVLESIGRSPYLSFAEDRECLSRLRARTRELADRLVVAVSAEALVDVELRTPVAAALAAALREMGLRAQIVDRCVGGVAVRGRGESTCALGPFGPQCALALDVDLRDCDSGALITTVNLRDAGLVGADPRTEASARANLVKQVTAARLLPALRAGLADYLPVHE